MKKGLYILILLFAGIHILGFFPIFKLLQYNIRQEVEVQIEKGIPNQNLSVVVVNDENSSELEWDMDGKEFFYKGKMYDVVKFEKEKGLVRYYCAEDKDETDLCSKMDNIVKKESKDGNSPLGDSTNDLVKILLQLYIPSQNCSLNPEVVVGLPFSAYISPLSYLFYEENTPPPKLV